MCVCVCTRAHAHTVVTWYMMRTSLCYMREMHQSSSSGVGVVCTVSQRFVNCTASTHNTRLDKRAVLLCWYQHQKSCGCETKDTWVIIHPDLSSQHPHSLLKLYGVRFFKYLKHIIIATDWLTDLSTHSQSLKSPFPSCGGEMLQYVRGKGGPSQPKLNKTLSHAPN